MMAIQRDWMGNFSAAWPTTTIHAVGLALALMMAELSSFLPVLASHRFQANTDCFPWWIRSTPRQQSTSPRSPNSITPVLLSDQQSSSDATDDSPVWRRADGSVYGLGPLGLCGGTVMFHITRASGIRWVFFRTNSTGREKFDVASHLSYRVRELGDFYWVWALLSPASIY